MNSIMMVLLRMQFIEYACMKSIDFMVLFLNVRDDDVWYDHVDIGVLAISEVEEQSRLDRTGYA